MALFGRKNKNTDNSGDNNVPVDLQQYYSSGGSGVMRWILRIVLLLVIFALLVWGGIWLFRTLTNNDEPAKTPAQGNTSQQAQADAKRLRPKQMLRKHRLPPTPKRLRMKLPLRQKKPRTRQLPR